ncbi:MAG: hypothetical protein ACJATN_001008 [Neolewinella sp.]|jgi:hypothetical protein
MRTNFLYFLLIAGFFLVSGALSAQNDYRVHYRIDDGKLLLRLAPKNIPTFLGAAAGAKYVDLYAVNPAIRSGEGPRLINQDELKPLVYEDWMNLKHSLYDTVGIMSVHFDRMNAEFKDIFEDTFDDQLRPEQYDTARINLLEYGNRNDFRAAERGGFALTFPIPPNVPVIAGKVYSPGSQDTFYFDVPIADYQPPALPELRVVWKSRNASLSWRTTEYREDYWGWKVEKSVEGGPFVPQFELPLENSFDTIVGAPDTANYLAHRDPRINNDEETTYRLYGIDYLGKRSLNYREVTGGGISDIQNSPLLIQGIQTDSNHAVLRWEMKAEDAPLVKEYLVVHRDTLGGEYETAMTGISPEAREVAVPMKFRSNYYRIQALSVRGTLLSSFESLVMSYDKDPPAMPTDFTGYIDTLGLVHLSWTTSNEVDLDGYYLFKGFEEKEEKAMITAIPLKGPTHTDTVSMVNPTETIYYQLRSVDTRGNSSNFTPILALKKPDIYPPIQPQFSTVKADGKAISLAWVRSPSDDVVGYSLFRRIVGDEAFDLVREWPADAPRRYLDSFVVADVDYEYIIKAADDDGLLSVASQPVALRLRSYGVRPPIQGFSLAGDAEERTITVSWTYDQAPREFYLYRGKDDQPVSLLKVLSGNDRSFADPGLKKGTTYKYLMRALFSNGKVSPFTEEVTLLLD